MFPIILLYAAAGALVTGGLFGGKTVLDVANDRAASERLRRRMVQERELIEEALATHEARAEAEKRGLDVDALLVRLHDSREAQQQIFDLLSEVLRHHGTTPESVRRLFENAAS
ncbi:MAG TPA: hypothetical protein VHC43_10565 [Mycobacteriales bacterium]|nr:hypothetical protein [Mycobacteriales bacterium]